MIDCSKARSCDEIAVQFAQLFPVRKALDLQWRGGVDFEWQVSDGTMYVRTQYPTTSLYEGKSPKAWHGQTAMPYGRGRVPR